PSHNAKNILTTDGDQTVDLEPRQVVPDPLEAALVLERVRAREPEDRAATRQNSTGGLDRELLPGVLERPPPAIPEADDRMVVAVDALADDRADHCVQAGTI